MHDPDPFPIVAGIAVLRRLEVNDLAAFQTYRSEPQVGRFQGWSVMSDKEATAFLSDMHACQLLRPGTWLQLGIAEPGSMRLLGDIGLRLAETQDEAEVGFTLAPQAQGRGVATAAVNAAIGLVFRQTPAKRVLGITDARNIASIRLLARVGMKKIGSTPAVFRGESCIEDSYARYRDSGAKPS
jgi:aminoglycoside 6'-N-acetyltransferase